MFVCFWSNKKDKKDLGLFQIWTVFFSNFDTPHFIDNTNMSLLNLERQDLLQLDPISSTGTLKLLPIGKKFKVCYFQENVIKVIIF
jgi:hypothetical protein